MSYDDILDDHIVNIVETQEIFEQLDLQNGLKKRGYDIPQATLSRRLKKLKIAKVTGVYKLIDFTHSSLPTVLKIDVSDYGLIVLHTYPGNANSLAYFIDKKYVSVSGNTGILGTIAGDDTVLLIIKSKIELESTLRLLHEAFPYLKI